MRYKWNEIKRSSKTKDGLLALLIYRKFAYVFTFLFANFVNASPNHVTTLALISWLSSAILIWYNYSILPAILIFLGFVLDCTDGNIARLRGQASLKGKLYDIAVDRISYSTILLVLAMKVSAINSFYYTVMLAGLLIVLMNITDMMRVYLEKIKGSDIHDAEAINNFESKIKFKLKKIVPIIDWDNIIIGPGADIPWTILMIASILPPVFTYFVAFLIFIIVCGLCKMISAC
jgi:phosphatidylglycerophosphate synthase